MDNIKIKAPSNLDVDYIKLQKMAFIYNAIQSGWTVKLNQDSYIFTKKHEGKKEIFLDTYMKSFIEKNMNIDTIRM
jgi:hypothetical protein